MCTQGGHQCFEDPNTLEKACTFNPTNGDIDCQCPGLDVSWEEALNTSIHVPGKNCSGTVFKNSVKNLIF